VTPTQLRAFVSVVQFGSVKKAAADIGVSEAAISLHVGQLRKELGDRLFIRTAAGISFTPGGVRLASRAAEMLGLQERTILEVSQAGGGRRLLRVAASSMFAERSAPGLIDLFTARAADLDVELSVHAPRQFPALLHARAVDVAVGPRPLDLDDGIACKPFLNYELIVVAGPEHPLTRGTVSLSQLREQRWLLGPSAVGETGVIPAMLRRVKVPEDHQQIFQSNSAALAEAKHGKGICIALSFAVSEDLANGQLVRVAVPTMATKGVWSILTLSGASALPAAAELARFVTTPRATQAMVRGSGVTVGRFRPSIHVTLWS
jgi:DNA-binding transcriptional LysR family regulator